MSWAALTSGGKEPILSFQKAIDSGKEVRYLVTARLKNVDSYTTRTIPGQLPIRAQKSGQRQTGMNWSWEGFPK
jgi:diphthine-ammonia ligase